MTQTSTSTQSEVVIRSAVPTFVVADVAGTANWYAANLGFGIAGTAPDRAPYVFASLQRGSAEIMLLSLENYEKPERGDRGAGGVWDAYVRVDGVHGLYETMEGKSFIKSPLTQRPYGDWEFEVRDPNGYVLVFGGAR